MKSLKITIFIIISLIFFMGALTTLVPNSSAISPSHLNYKAVCPFSPFSTLILLLIGGFFMGWVIKIRKLGNDQ